MSLFWKLRKKERKKSSEQTQQECSRQVLIRIARILKTKYQITTILTYGHKIPDGLNTYIQNGHEINQHVPLQGPQKFTIIGIFGLKIYHLATLALIHLKHDKRHKRLLFESEEQYADKIIDKNSPENIPRFSIATPSKIYLKWDFLV
jgi:hypothetical protein